jgi:uncharacterized protein involved in exopolysaccharide biosynthesis
MITSEKNKRIVDSESVPIQDAAFESGQADAGSQLSMRGMTNQVRTKAWLTNVLLENRRWLLKCGIAGLVFSTAVAFLIPARYEATARLMPPDQSNMNNAVIGMLAAKAGDTLGSIASDTLGLRTTGAMLVGILQSRTVQDDLVNQFDLRRVYWKKKYDDARKVLAKRTEIYEDRKSGIISISVQDRSPERAMQMAGAYVEDLNRRVAQLSTSSARRERIFLEERLASIKEDLDKSSLELSQFSSRNKTMNPEIQGKAMLEAASNLQGQLVAAEAELSGLQNIYGPAHHRTLIASGKVTELRNRMRQFSGSPSSNGTRLATNTGDPYPSLEQLPLLGATYLRLYRRARINEAIYDALTQQYELAKVQEAKEIPTIRVLDQPELPEHKAFPPRTAIVLLGTLAFIAVGCALIASQLTMQQLPEHDKRRVIFDWLLNPSA